MTRATATVQINVTAAPPAGAVPALGAAKLVGAAGAHTAVLPTGEDSGTFTKALFEAFGSGTFVQDYSADGAFVVAGSGGHNHAGEIIGGAGFDFTSRSWFWRATPGWAESITPVQIGDTNGSPWLELNAAPAQTPAPPHPYGSMCQIRAADGGGAKGSIIHVGRSAVTGLSVSSPTAHRFDCATGVWSRASAGTMTAYNGNENTAFFDPVAKRYYSWSGENQHARTAIPYLDVADWTFKEVAGIGYFTPGSTQYSKAMYWSGNGKRLILAFWPPYRYILDLDYPVAGWRPMSYTGPTFDASFNVPAWHQGNGNLYWRASSGAGNTLVKVVPPADPINGTWVGSTVTLSGDAIPEFMGSGVTTEAYKSLFYIPSLNMLGWVTAFGVSLINPN